jgi:hypothetical protein
MLKICRDKWDKNSKKLEEILKNDTKLNSCDYKYLVEVAFESIFNSDDNEYGEDLNIKAITEIDNGDYQGTFIYLIPRNTYQPSEYDYLMTYVGYGSCSGCDTLQAIQDWNEGAPTETQLKDFMMLCKDIIINTVKPYNSGWRNDEKYETIE